MSRWLFLGILLFVSPVLAQPYSGPPDGAAYWTVQAFKDHPIKGPQAAKGVVLWSHGVAGKTVQYTAAPAPLMLRFARAGWDVIKVQRNPTHERGWIPSGVRHVADVVVRAEKAKADGYRQVIAAGQSYGGAISIEASGKTTAIDGVIALAPGHGSDAGGDARLRQFDSLTGQLIDAIGKAQTPRLVVMIAENDPLHPFELRGPKLRAALQKRGKPFVLFDESMPLKGHGAGGTSQFDQWYGACILTFITTANAKSGETLCEGPLMVGKFALPRDMKIVPPAATVPANLAILSGHWSGTMTGGYQVQLIFERVDAKQTQFVYATVTEKGSPSWARRTAVAEGISLASRTKGSDFSIVFDPPGPDGVLKVIVTGTNGAIFTATLKRGSGSQSD